MLKINQNYPIGWLIQYKKLSNILKRIIYILKKAIITYLHTERTKHVRGYNETIKIMTLQNNDNKIKLQITFYCSNTIFFVCSSASVYVCQSHRLAFLLANFVHFQALFNFISCSTFCNEIKD